MPFASILGNTIERGRDAIGVPGVIRLENDNKVRMSLFTIPI
jgi:hypothetical protein